MLKIVLSRNKKARKDKMQNNYRCKTNLFDALFLNTWEFFILDNRFFSLWMLKLQNIPEPDILNKNVFLPGWGISVTRIS